MRQKSIDIFSETKKRFQFKPTSRKLNVLQVLGKKKVYSHSTGKQKEKENQNNDFSWLDKLIVECEIKTNRIDDPLFEQSEIKLEKPLEQRRSASKSKNIIQMIKQHQIKNNNKSAKKIIPEKQKRLLTEQRKAKYGNKKNTRNCQNPNENNLNKNSYNNDVIILSQRLSIRNDEKLSDEINQFLLVEYKSNGQQDTKIVNSSHSVQKDALKSQQRILEQISEAEEKLNMSESFQITIIKVIDNQKQDDIEKANVSACHIIPNIYESQNIDSLQKSRQFGCIKKNNKKKFNTIQTQTQNTKMSPVKEYLLTQQPQKIPELESVKQKIVKRRYATLQQDQNHLLSSLIDTKFFQIFNQLDAKQKGLIDRTNCNDSNLNECIKSLLKPIFDLINLQNASFSKQQFLNEMCRKATSLNDYSLNRLFRLPVLDSFKKRNQQINIKSIKSEIKRKNYFQQHIDRNKQLNILKKVDSQCMKKYSYSTKYLSQQQPLNLKTQQLDRKDKRLSVENIENKNVWKQLSKQYQINKQASNNNIHQLPNQDETFKQKNISKYSTRIQSLNSTIGRQKNHRQQNRNRSTQNFLFIEQRFPLREFPKNVTNKCALEEQSNRIEKLNDRLSNYIKQYIPENEASIPRGANVKIFDKHYSY